MCDTRGATLGRGEGPGCYCYVNSLLRDSLSRLAGGIGGRGPGETKLEIDRRRVRDRITALERRVADLDPRLATARVQAGRDDAGVVEHQQVVRGEQAGQVGGVALDAGDAVGDPAALVGRPLLPSGEEWGGLP